MGEAIQSFFEMTGFSMIANDPKVLIMIVISLVLMYLAIVKKFEPLLLLPIAFGMLLTNLPGAEMYHRELFASGHVDWAKLSDQGGLIDYLYLGIKLGIYPCLIFMGVGAGTDFGPLIANPKTLFMGAAAQLGIFIAFMGAIGLTALFPNAFNFGVREASSIGIIGGADGPTAIYVTLRLAPQLLGHCRCSVFLHGACSRNSAAYNEGADHKEGTPNIHGAAQACFQNRKDNIPHSCYYIRVPAGSLCGSAYRHADVW